MSNPSRLDHALRMASLGLLVFPLRPGAKEPFRDESWADMATTDPDQIRAWFENRQGMNYGVCPGEHGVILDLDRKGDLDGVETLNVMMQEFGDIPHTLHCRSPSGGEHLFLRVHEPVGNVHRFGENSGIDVRGHRGYVVGPGSSLIQGLCKETDTPGDYEVIEDPGELAEAPGWVVSRLRRPSEKAEGHERDPLFDLDKESAVRRAVSFLNDREPAIEGDHGNDHTYATVNHLFDYGLSPDKAFELLATEPLRKKGDESWNDTCVPPWPDDELRRLVDNAWRYRIRPPGSKGNDPEESFGALGEEVEGQDISTVEGVAEAVAEAENPFSKLESMIFRGDEILQRDVRRHSIIPEWLPAHGLTALLAKRGVGKTVTLIDMMGRIAHDIDWHGQPVEEGWTVVYFCGEDDEGFGELLRAWCQKHTVLLDPDRFIMVAGIVDLMDPKNVGDWTRLLKKKVVKDRKTIVVLDTWQRGTSRGSQNDDEDMNKAVSHAEAMAKSLGGPVVASFHPPKHDGQVVMGSSVIENQTVAIWHEDQLGDGSRQLMVTRIKGKGYGNQMHFTFDEVGLNEVDEHGKERTGVVPTLKWGIDAGGAADTGSRSDAEKKYDLALIIAELCKDRAGQDWSGGRDSFTIRELARRILPDPNFNDGMPSLLQQSMDKTDEGELSETAVWARGLIDQFVGIGIDVYRMKVGALRNRLMKEGPDSDMKLGDGTTLVVDASSNKKLLSVRYTK